MRISRHQLFMGIARIVSQRSTCFRGNVGAILVNDRSNIVSIGYNGPPSGEDHCYGNECPLDEGGGCTRSTHAEMNVLKRITYGVGIGWRELQLYVTSSPCPNCAKDIIRGEAVGTIYYESPYRIYTGVEELLRNGIDIYRFTPSGYLIEEATGKVLEAN